MVRFAGVALSIILSLTISATCAFASGSTVNASGFLMGEYNTIGCQCVPAIDSAADCDNATADALGLSFGRVDAWTNAPPGCFESVDGNLYFNTNTNGSAHPNRRSICNEVTTTCSTTQAANTTSAGAVSTSQAAATTSAGAGDATTSQAAAATSAGAGDATTSQAAAATSAGAGAVTTSPAAATTSGGAGDATTSQGAATTSGGAATTSDAATDSAGTTTTAEAATDSAGAATTEAATAAAGAATTLEAAASTSTTTEIEYIWYQGFVIISGLDFDTLMADDDLVRDVSQRTKEVIVEQCSCGITADHVDIVLSAGSVRADYTVSAPAGSSADGSNAASALSSSADSGSLGNSLASSLSSVPGIENAQYADLAVSAGSSGASPATGPGATGPGATGPGNDDEEEGDSVGTAALAFGVLAICACVIAACIIGLLVAIRRKPKLAHQIKDKAAPWIPGLRSTGKDASLASTGGGGGNYSGSQQGETIKDASAPNIKASVLEDGQDTSGHGPPSKIVPMGGVSGSSGPAEGPGRTSAFSVTATAGSVGAFSAPIGPNGVNVALSSTAGASDSRGLSAGPGATPASGLSAGLGSAPDIHVAGGLKTGLGVQPGGLVGPGPYDSYSRGLGPGLGSAPGHGSTPNMHAAGGLNTGLGLPPGSYGSGAGGLGAGLGSAPGPNGSGGFFAEHGSTPGPSVSGGLNAGFGPQPGSYGSGGGGLSAGLGSTAGSYAPGGFSAVPGPTASLQGIGSTGGPTRGFGPGGPNMELRPTANLNGVVSTGAFNGAGDIGGERNSTGGFKGPGSLSAVLHETAAGINGPSGVSGGLRSTGGLTADGPGSLGTRLGQPNGLDERFGVNVPNGFAAQGNGNGDTCSTSSRRSSSKMPKHPRGANGNGNVTDPTRPLPQLDDYNAKDFGIASMNSEYARKNGLLADQSRRNGEAAPEPDSDWLFEAGCLKGRRWPAANATDGAASVGTSTW